MCKRTARVCICFLSPELITDCILAPEPKQKRTRELKTEVQLVDMHHPSLNSEKKKKKNKPGLTVDSNVVEAAPSPEELTAGDILADESEPAVATKEAEEE